MNKKVEDFYNKHLKKDIEEIDAPKDPAYLFSKIKFATHYVCKYNLKKYLHA